MGDKTAKLALIISLITLALVVSGVVFAYFMVRGLVTTQVDSVIAMLEDLKVRKFLIPIRVDRVVEFPVDTSVPINLSTTVELVLNESITTPIRLDIPLEIPVNIPLEVPIKDSLRFNYSTISKSYVVIGGQTYELEIPVNISTEIPVSLVAKTAINATVKTVVYINTTVPINILKPIKTPINTSVDIPIKYVFKVPIKLDITYEFTLKDLGLDRLVDQLINALEEVRKKI